MSFLKPGNSVITVQRLRIETKFMVIKNGAGVDPFTENLRVSPLINYMWVYLRYVPADPYPAVILLFLAKALALMWHYQNSLSCCYPL